MALPVTRAALILLVLLLCIEEIRTQEVEDEKEFTYEEGEATGPEHWGNLHEEWRACGNGHRQSPINVVKKSAQISPGLGKLRKIYFPANATLFNTGHSIMVKWAIGAGSIEIEGKRFRLNQCHWHTPAEHTVDGRRYPLEIHLVHESKDKKIAVVGILYTYGRFDTFLAEKHEKNARPIQSTNGRVVKMYTPKQNPQLH